MIGKISGILNTVKRVFQKHWEKKQHNARFPEYCPVCGASFFKRSAIIWDSLSKEWELTPRQRSYIDDQQGISCCSCNSNLRSMTLASAILTRLRAEVTLADYCENNATARAMRILEINEAGSLTPYFSKFPNHLLAVYPEYDMQRLALADSSFDLILHSDTLEHVPESIRALKECRRVLSPGGFLAYTIPIIHDRLTRSRRGLAPSYHGIKGVNEFLVCREYGSDFWCELFDAGFRNIHLHSIIFPASVAVIAE